VNAAIASDATLPLTYYRPFKAAVVYLQKAFPEWNGDADNRDGLTDSLADKLWYAEQYFNVVKLEDKYENEQAYEDF
jgi:hypothetical protein